MRWRTEQITLEIPTVSKKQMLLSSKGVKITCVNCVCGLNGTLFIVVQHKDFAANTCMSRKRKARTEFSLVRKEAELTLYTCIELHRLLITFVCTFCSDSQNGFMTFEETESREVDVIVQDAQTANT